MKFLSQRQENIPVNALIDKEASSETTSQKNTWRNKARIPTYNLWKELNQTNPWKLHCLASNILFLTLIDFFHLRS